MAHGSIEADDQQREENKKNGEFRCERCSGTGNELYYAFKQCTACQGKGYYDCPNCKGSGCHSCDPETHLG